MAETSGPWDGSGFAQDEWRLLHRNRGGENGVMGFSSGSLSLQFSSSNREITVTPGIAVVQGNLYFNDSDLILDSPTPSGSNQRIDYVALRYDQTEPVLDDRIKAVLIQGQEASDPSPPSVEQTTTGVYEMPLARLGPYGTGAISGSPVRNLRYVLRDVQPVNLVDPNDQAEGHPRKQGDIAITYGTSPNTGRLWYYDTDAEEYLRLGDPQTGTIPLASGWAPSTSGNTPRWWVKDGLVHLGGVAERTGSDFQVPTDAPGTKFTGSLPSAIRPGREMTLNAMGRVARNSSAGSHRESIALYYDSDNRLGVTDGINPIRYDSNDREQWMRSGGAGRIYLHDISWVIF